MYVVCPFDGSAKNDFRYSYLNERYKFHKQDTFLLNTFGAKLYDETEIPHPKTLLRNFMDCYSSYLATVQISF